MKRIFLSLLLTVSCSHKASEETVVWDSDKPESYYVADSCDSEGHSHSTTAWDGKEEAQEKWSTNSRSVAALTGRKDIDDIQKCPDVTEGEVQDIISMIGDLGGKTVNPSKYPNTVQGLQDFLDDSGVKKYFSAKDMVDPNNPAAAKKCKLGSQLLPPKCRWPSGAVQALLADKLKAQVKSDIILRNWWRPACYNKAVAGASASDHIQARGFDLDFKTPEDRAKAQKYLCDMYKKDGINLQVGIGCNTLHVGIGSPKRLSSYPEDGSRYWTYGSLRNCKVKRAKGDDCWVSGGGKKYIHQGNTKGKFTGAL